MKKVEIWSDVTDPGLPQSQALKDRTTQLLRSRCCQVEGNRGGVPGVEVVFYYSWFVIFWFLDMSQMHGRRVSKARTMRGGPWSGGGVLIFMPVSARGTEQGGSLPLSP